MNYERKYKLIIKYFYMYWDKIKFNSDKSTVSPNWDDLSIRYHYNFIENSIIQNIKSCNNVLDVGSGYGHWINFYQDVYGAEVEALDPGLNEYKCVKHRCVIENFESQKKYDVINAIGILHHIIDDKKISKAIQICYNHLCVGGYFIIGTRFDFMDNPKEKLRKFRTLEQWKFLLCDFEFIRIKRSNPPYYCKKHLDLIVVKKQV